jgi:ketosteroid isomerase-like protein
MARADVAIVRGYWDAWSRGDYQGALAAFHREVEWRMADDEPDARVLRGVEEVRRMVASWQSSFEGFSATPQDFIEADGQVVVPILFSGRPRGSSIPIETEEIQVFTVAAEKIVMVREYRRLADALAAARIEPG